MEHTPWCDISSYPFILRFMASHRRCSECALHIFHIGSGRVFQSISVSSLTGSASILQKKWVSATLMRKTCRTEFELLDENTRIVLAPPQFLALGLDIFDK